MSIVESLLDFLFPPKCAACGTLLEGDRQLRLCPACFRKLDVLDGKVCKLCGKPFCGDALLCEDCNASRPPYVMGFAGCVYDGLAREMMLDMKFHNKPHLFRVFAALVIRRLDSMPGFVPPDVVTCVPMRPEKERERGYNPAALLARQVARHYGWAFAADLLDKVRDTKVQSTLSREERYQNVKGAYVVRAAKEVQGKRILLVDDVCTTGATFRELAELLQKAGAAEVICASAATTRHGEV